MSETEVSEQCRVLAPVETFRGLAKGAAVELCGTVRVVTSATDNIARSGFFTVGLSAEFERSTAAYRGTRREGGNARTLELPLDVLLLESGKEEGFAADSAAPSMVAIWLAAVRREDWREETEPNFGDEMTAAKDGAPLFLKVLSYERSDGWYVLKCREARRRQW